jgi:hypothetical protein
MARLRGKWIDSYTGRLLAALDLDGGWLTLQGLKLMLPEIGEEPLRGSLDNSRASGYIESRTRGHLNQFVEDRIGIGPTGPSEYRITDYGAEKLNHALDKAAGL